MKTIKLRLLFSATLLFYQWPRSFAIGVNFLVDAQLPPALARWISAKGHQAAHVFDLGFHTVADLVIWERARNDHAVIITKDEDFVDQWILSSQPVPLVWI